MGAWGGLAKTPSVRCPGRAAQPQSQSCPRKDDQEVRHLTKGSPSGGRWPPTRVASLLPKVLTGPGGCLGIWFTHLKRKTVKPVTQEQWPPGGRSCHSSGQGCYPHLEGGGRRCCSPSRRAQDGHGASGAAWEALPSEHPGSCETSRHLSLFKSLFLLFRGSPFIRLLGFTISPPLAKAKSFAPFRSC